MKAFELTERTLEPGCREIQIEGELDLSVADRLEEALARAGQEHEQILIGLEHCEFIDSTGIAVIVHAHAQLAERGRRLTVYGASSQVHRVLAVTGLTQDGLVFANADEARSVPE
jgi:anti-sigma B factor antagonist